MINPLIIALEDWEISALKTDLMELRALHKKMGIESQKRSYLENLIDELPFND